MASKEKSPTRVTTGKVLLSYVHLNKPFKDPKKPDEKPKYKLMVVVDKKDKETIAKIRAAIKYCEKKMITEKYGGKPPKKAIENSFNDGDEHENEELEGKYYINVWSYRKPPIVDRHREPIEDEDEIYSGMFARVCVNFYYYWGDESKGITAGLESIQKVANGPRLGGGFADVNEDFGDDFDDFEDDYGHDSDDEDYDL